jgi:hypothetical protein
MADDSVRRDLLKLGINMEGLSQTIFRAKTQGSQSPQKKTLETRQRFALLREKFFRVLFVQV